MPSSLIAVADACVLVPAALCDFLLRAASAGLYHLRWTNDMLDEVRRTLASDLGKSDVQAQRRIDAMKRAFPDALISAHRTLISSIPEGVDAKDRHVVAAAVAAGAPVIVTSNLRDFPASALAPLGIEAQSPNDFLTDLLALDPEGIGGRAAAGGSAAYTANDAPRGRRRASVLRDFASNHAALISTIALRGRPHPWRCGATPLYLGNRVQ